MLFNCVKLFIFLDGDGEFEFDLEELFVLLIGDGNFDFGLGFIVSFSFDSDESEVRLICFFVGEFKIEFFVAGEEFLDFEIGFGSILYK